MILIDAQPLTLQTMVRKLTSVCLPDSKVCKLTQSEHRHPKSSTEQHRWWSKRFKTKNLDLETQCLSRCPKLRRPPTNDYILRNLLKSRFTIWSKSTLRKVTLTKFQNCTLCPWKQSSRNYENWIKSDSSTSGLSSASSRWNKWMSAKTI